MIRLASLVLIAVAALANSQKLQHIENDQICTSWLQVTPSMSIDTTPCASSLKYELSKKKDENLVRFCCTHKAGDPPIVGLVPESCGRPSFTPIRGRIVGGQEAAQHSWPWLVSLQYRENHFCGGTLIDQQHVVTAAHCLQDSSILNSEFTIVAGLHSRSSQNAFQIQRKQVANITNHQDYNPYTLANDVAVIRLSSPVKLDKYVNTACLPTTRDPYINENVIVAGWGATSFGGNSPDELRQVNLLIMEQCKNVYEFDERKQLCAGNHRYDKDSCQGDSGGPLMHEISGKWTLSGIVSYGEECAKVHHPGVYARVSYYIPWIKRAIGQ